MKTYVLNLPSSRDRLAAFRSVWPSTLPRCEVWEARPPEACEKPSWWLGTPEFNSHRVNFLEVLTACADSGESFLFFEDDCLFAPDFEVQYETFLGEVPSGFECLNLCCNHMCSGLYPPVRISENVLRPRLGFNTNAMYFTPSGAAKMKAQLELPFWGCKHIVEQQLGFLYRDSGFRVYAPFQNFVGQAPCWSELCRRDRGERWYNHFRYRDLSGNLQNSPAHYETFKE